MKPYTDKFDKIDERKSSYSNIRGNEKPRKTAARRVAKEEIKKQNY